MDCRWQSRAATWPPPQRRSNPLLSAKNSTPKGVLFLMLILTVGKSFTFKNLLLLLDAAL